MLNLCKITFNFARRQYKMEMCSNNSVSILYCPKPVRKNTFLSNTRKQSQECIDNDRNTSNLCDKYLNLQSRFLIMENKNMILDQLLPIGNELNSENILREKARVENEMRKRGFLKNTNNRPLNLSIKSLNHDFNDCLNEKCLSHRYSDPLCNVIPPERPKNPLSKDPIFTSQRFDLNRFGLLQNSNNETLRANIHSLKLSRSIL